MQFSFLDDIADRTASVPGLTVRNDYVDAAMERELVASIDEQAWESDFKRRIQQYGYGYGDGMGAFSTPKWVRDLPEFLAPLARKLVDDAVLDRFPENCVINEYLPGTGIGRHRDYLAFGPTIAAVSLGSDVVIDFLEPQRELKVPVAVPARSVWIATGEARLHWQHAIAPRQSDLVDGVKRRRGRRLSVTFRTATERTRRASGRA